MVDAEMASHLWLRIQQDVCTRYGIQHVTHELLTRVQKVARAKVPTLLQACAVETPQTRTKMKY